MPKGFLRTVLALIAATVGGAALADDAKLVKRSYPVGEFVSNVRPTPTPPARVPPVPVQPTVTPVQAAQFAAPVPTPPPVRQLPPEVRCNAESLARMVVNVVKPYSWAEMGGAGRVTFDEATCSLVVTQTADVHAHVADLIATMQRINVASVPMVRLEMVVVEVPEALAEPAGDAPVQAAGGTSVPTPACPEGELCQVMKAVRAAEKAKGTPVVALSDTQAQCLMKCVRADPRASVLSRPQMMLTDMQECFFQVGQTVQFKNGPAVFTQSGLSIRATPKVSADRRYVELRLNYQTTHPNPNPVEVKLGEGADAEVITAPVFDRQEIETRLAFLTGKTVLLAGPIVMRKQAVVNKPVPSQVPHMNQVARRETGPMKCRQLLVVKATVGTADELFAAVAARHPMVVKACPAVDCKACPAACETVAVAKPVRPADAEASRLVAAYHKACADGRSEDALRVAMQALSRDPNCFADPK